MAVDFGIITWNNTQRELTTLQSPIIPSLKITKLACRTLNSVAIMASARAAIGRWLHKCGNLEVSDAKRLRPTEEENRMVRSSLQIEAKK